MHLGKLLINIKTQIVYSKLLSLLLRALPLIRRFGGSTFQAISELPADYSIPSGGTVKQFHSSTKLKPAEKT